MNQNNGLASLLERLLWPEQRAISESERKFASNRIARVKANGLITEEQAQERYAQLAIVRTQAELRMVLAQLPGAATSLGLKRATRLAFVLWVGASIIQLIVWTLICMFSASWEEPWWLWTALPGAPLVAGLWWLAERDQQPPALQESTDPSRL